MRNSDFGHARGDRPALDEVAQTDLFLDALAARTESELGDPDNFEDQVLSELLGDWRDDLRWPPASALVSQEEAEQALREGMLHRGRGGRGLAAVGSVAATLLMLSGFGAVVADARPGDLLYGLHAMMFNEPRVSDDQIALSAKADLAKVEQMIAQGQWDQAQTQLAEVSNTLQAVNDGGRRQGLLDEVNQLNTKVEKRDPYAGARPASPTNPQLVVPTAPGNLPGNSLTPPLAPGPDVTEPATPTPSAPPSGPPDTTTTPPVPSPSVTSTKKHRPSSTTPSPTPTTSPTPSATPPTTTPSSAPPTTGNTKTGTSVPSDSPTAAPGSVAPTTPSGQMGNRPSAPVGSSGVLTPPLTSAAP